MSTSAQLSPAWKQEVNRRLAEHRGRKGAVATESGISAVAQPNASQRAMEAAARVAARYANAPSYSEMLANEARAALRAAEAASRAAMHAQAAAQSVLAGLEAASAVEAGSPAEVFPALPEPVAEWPINPVAQPAAAESMLRREEVDWQQQVHADAGRELVRPETLFATPAVATALDEPVSIRWDAGLPVRPVEPVAVRAARGQDLFETGSEAWWRPAVAEAERLEAEPIEVVEATAIPANLIEFPRELVATRKARPRLAEGYSAAPEAGTQLSIFEVDPVTLLPEAELASAAGSAAWPAPTWSGIELEELPASVAGEAIAEPLPEQAAAPAIEPAPATQRLMALVVDAALVAGGVLSTAMLAATHAHMLPGPRATEIVMAVALLLAAGLYQALFFTLGRATPGMRYARVRLSTFEGLMPTRAQRWRRMAALLLSVLPVGIGLAWALFDENRLSWHDRLSRTYLCRR